MEQNKEYTLARLILRLANRIVKNRDRHVKELGLTTEQADSLLFFLDRNCRMKSAGTSQYSAIVLRSDL